MAEISYRRHRFPPVIIQHSVWLYLRFTLSYRDVEELLAERGLDISYETVRCWVLKFGPMIARRLRRHRQSRVTGSVRRRVGCYSHLDLPCANGHRNTGGGNEIPGGAILIPERVHKETDTLASRIVSSVCVQTWATHGRNASDRPGRSVSPEGLLSAHLLRCRALQRRSPNRPRNRRSARPVRTGLPAPKPTLD